MNYNHVTQQTAKIGDHLLFQVEEEGTERGKFVKGFHTFLLAQEWADRLHVRSLENKNETRYGVYEVLADQKLEQVYLSDPQKAAAHWLHQKSKNHRR